MARARTRQHRLGRAGLGRGQDRTQHRAQHIQDQAGLYMDVGVSLCRGTLRALPSNPANFLAGRCPGDPPHFLFPMLDIPIFSILDNHEFPISVFWGITSSHYWIITSSQYWIITIYQYWIIMSSQHWISPYSQCWICSYS